MSTFFGLRYTQKGGLQIPERFEGGLKDTLLFTRATVSPPAKTSEQMGLATEGSIEGEEELVIKALDDRTVETDLVSGASILGDGRVVLILNLAIVAYLIYRIRSEKPARRWP